MSEIIDIRDQELGARLFCLFKGEPGTGKTVAAASFPDPLFIDLDRRTAPIKKMFPTKSVRVKRPDTFNEFWDFVMEFREDCGTLVIDGLTRLADKTLGFSIDLAGGPADRWGPNRNQSDNLRTKHFPAPAEIQDWGGEDRGLAAILDALQVLPCHVILTAHVITTEQTELKKGVGRITHTSRSLITGGKKIAAKIGLWFDEAYHFNVESPLGVEETRYTILTEHTGNDWAKTALPLPRQIDFTMRPGEPGLYDQIMKHVNAEKAVVRL